MKFLKQACLGASVFMRIDKFKYFMFDSSFRVDTLQTWFILMRLIKLEQDVRVFTPTHIESGYVLGNAEAGAIVLFGSRPIR